MEAHVIWDSPVLPSLGGRRLGRKPPRVFAGCRSATSPGCSHAQTGRWVLSRPRGARPLAAPERIVVLLVVLVDHIGPADDLQHLRAHDVRDHLGRGVGCHVCSDLERLALGELGHLGERLLCLVAVVAAQHAGALPREPRGLGAVIGLHRVRVRVAHIKRVPSIQGVRRRVGEQHQEIDRLGLAALDLVRNDLETDFHGLLAADLTLAVAPARRDRLDESRKFDLALLVLPSPLARPSHWLALRQLAVVLVSRDLEDDATLPTSDGANALDRFHDHVGEATLPDAAHAPRSVGVDRHPDDARRQGVGDLREPREAVCAEGCRCAVAARVLVRKERLAVRGRLLVAPCRVAGLDQRPPLFAHFPVLGGAQFVQVLVGRAGFAVPLKARLVQRRALERLEHRALVQHQGERAVVALAGRAAHGLDLLRLVQGEVCHDDVDPLLLDLGVHHYHVEPTRVVGGEERHVLLAHGEAELALHVALPHLRRHDLLDLHVAVGREGGEEVAGLFELAKGRLGVEVDQHGALLHVGGGVDHLSEAVVLRGQVGLEDHAPLRPSR
mmetsp:Transcript_76014/g.216970  ORF Transcript_76014/g.216970 Transcript_76014/m.216970 type:complete len:556 (-) Transcript_76014:779-2446(-)